MTGPDDSTPERPEARAPIRVLTVMTRPTRSGGIPNVVRTILRNSDPALVRHHLCQLRPLAGDLADVSTPALEEVFSLGLRGRWTRSPNAIPAAIRLLGAIRRIRPDVIHLHSGASLIALPSRALLGSARYGWLIDLHEPMQVRHSRLAARCVSMVARRGGWCVTHSPPVTEVALGQMGIPADRVAFIPLGIDAGRFASQDMDRRLWRERFDIPGNATLIVTVGRVSELKGTARLVAVAESMRALGLLDNHMFAVIGHGPGAGQAQEEIDARGLGGHVRLLGYVPDLASALNAADIYIAPSSYEGFGLAVVEAMASGLPVVASAVGGLTYVVEHGETGYLVDPEDIEGFARDLARLAANPGHRRELGRRARRRATEHFDERRMAADYDRLYLRIAAHGAQR